MKMIDTAKLFLGLCFFSSFINLFAMCFPNLQIKLLWIYSSVFNNQILLKMASGEKFVAAKKCF